MAEVVANENEDNESAQIEINASCKGRVKEIEICIGEARDNVENLSSINEIKAKSSQTTMHTSKIVVGLDVEDNRMQGPHDKVKMSIDQVS
jgi:precorrin-6B methylase 2